MEILSANAVDSLQSSAQLDDAYDQFERLQATYEKTLGLIGYVPGICAVGGYVRIASGAVQFIQFTALAVFFSISDLFQKNEQRYGYRTARNLYYAVHASCNVLRGGVEVHAAIGARILLVVYDFLLSARLKYIAESKPEYTDPYVRLKTWLIGKA